MPMPPRENKSHLPHDEVKQNYRTCTQKKKKIRWHLIWLMVRPKNSLLVTQAAETVGLCERWARMLVHRYNDQGPAGLIDKRKENTGNDPLLSEKQKNALRKALLHDSPPDGGLWTSVKVADWIKEETGSRPSKVTGWQYLKNLGFTLQTPRPQHRKSATEAEKTAFKKKFPIR